MPVLFDSFHLSLRINLTLKEYKKYTINGRIPDIFYTPDVDRGKFQGAYRHEMAHFLSYLAGGLSDVIHLSTDYRLAFLAAVYRKYLVNGNHSKVTLPLIRDGKSELINGKEVTLLRDVWNSINKFFGYLEGFGDYYTISQLTNLHAHTGFWSLFYENEFRFIVNRFYEITSSHVHINEENYLNGRALPEVEIRKEKRILSSRSVIEAYALSIEFIHTFFKGVFSSTEKNFMEQLRKFHSPDVQNPGPHYTVAIEYFFTESGLFHPAVTLSDFLTKKAPQQSYYTLALVSFVAMMLPLAHTGYGETVISGSLTDLCPAVRFYKITKAIKEKKITIPSNLANCTDQNLELFFEQCDEILCGVSLCSMYREIMADLPRDISTGQINPIILMSMKARYNFWINKKEYIFEATVATKGYPNFPLFIFTSDNRVISNKKDNWYYEYIRIHKADILEACLFGDYSNAIWKKMIFFEGENRSGLLVAALTGLQPFISPDESVRDLTARLMKIEFNLEQAAV